MATDFTEKLIEIFSNYDFMFGPSLYPGCPLCGEPADLTDEQKEQTIKEFSEFVNKELNAN